MKAFRLVIFLLTISFLFIGPSQILCQSTAPGYPLAGVTPPPRLPQDPPPFLDSAKPPLPLERVSPGVFRLGDIKINKKNRSISFPAQVNMTGGLLEYVLVRGSGKVHESLLRTPLDPYHLQIAFLLLGFEPTDRPLAHQGSPEIPRGEPVEITIAYSKGNGIATGEHNFKVKPEDWISVKTNGATRDPGPIHWVFTGSRIFQGRFQAHAEGSIIAVYHDPAALIDNASPGGESDKIWFIKEGAVPPLATPVSVTIRAKKEK